MEPTISTRELESEEQKPQAIRLLVVEDSELDHELLLRSLARQGLAPSAIRVEDAASLSQALLSNTWDAIICDHHLPRFSSDEALRMARTYDPGIPFVIVSGTIGEDVAVAAMQAGADDYLVKGRLARLGPALRNAMSAAAARRERASAQHALAESEQRLRALTAHLQIALEAERAAIAREIHDDVGGMLTALRFDLSWLERHGNQETIRLRARQGLDTLNQAVLAVHRIMRDLRPPALDAGIVAALDFLASQTTRRTGIDVSLHTNHDSISLGEPIAITVYRVAQEALTNVAKHSGATRAHIDLMVRNDTLSIEVSDNGRGIRQKDMKKEGSFGLRGLTERVRQVKGWLDISTDVGRAALIATIPLTEQAAASLEDGLEG